MGKEQLIALLNKGLELEHAVRHILMEEQEHITELELLLGRQGNSYNG